MGVCMCAFIHTSGSVPVCMCMNVYVSVCVCMPVCVCVCVCACSYQSSSHSVLSICCHTPHMNNIPKFFPIKLNPPRFILRSTAWEKEKVIN